MSEVPKLTEIEALILRAQRKLPECGEAKIVAIAKRMVDDGLINPPSNERPAPGLTGAGRAALAAFDAAERAAILRPALDLLRLALTKIPPLVRYGCTLCGDSTFDHYCNDREVPSLEHEAIRAFIAKESGA